MSVFGPVERLFPESTEAKGVVGQFEAVLAAVSSPKFCTHTLEVDLLLAPAANGRGRRQESTHVALPFERHDSDPVLDVREAAILRTEHHTVWQCHETNWCLARDRKCCACLDF